MDMEKAVYCIKNLIILHLSVNQICALTQQVLYFLSDFSLISNPANLVPIL